MPWKETNIMQQRIQFIQAWLTRRYTKVELCKQFNISRPTADKWIKRHQQVGFDGLAELSRRPQHSPHTTPQWISEWLIAQKLKRPDWGAKKLLDLFARTFPEQHKPADSTGDLILARAGLVKPRKRRRKVSADSQPFNECTHANSTWCGLQRTVCPRQSQTLLSLNRNRPFQSLPVHVSGVKQYAKRTRNRFV